MTGKLLPRKGNFRSDIEYEGCSNCEYATVYIPVYTYPFMDPFCSKGHGRCSPDKFCVDYRLIGTHYCYECKYCTELHEGSYCAKKDEFIDRNSRCCVYKQILEVYLK